MAQWDFFEKMGCYQKITLIEINILILKSVRRFAYVAFNMFVC